MNNIYRATPSLLAAPPEPLLMGKSAPISPEKLEQIHHDFGEDHPAPKIDRDLVKDIIRIGLDRGYANAPSDEYKLDRWLAPRLHSAIRLPRRIASDRRFWAWVAMSLAPKYVFARFQSNGRVNPWRFTDDLLRNAVSRLWWAAELLRNGPDYSAVDAGLKTVRTAQFALELRYSWYRPATIAFVETVAGPPPATDDQMKELSKRANAYLSLAPLEAIGFDEGTQEADDAWWNDCPTLSELIGSDPLVGPKDEYANPKAVVALKDWFSDVLAEAKGSGS